MYDEVVKDEKHELVTLNHPEVEELAKLILLRKSNLRFKLENVEKLAKQFSSTFTGLLETLLQKFNNSEEQKEVLNEVKTKQSKILQNIENMSISDKDKLTKYFTNIHNFIIKEYERQEIIKPSYQNDSEQELNVESIISSYSQKYKELTKRIELEEKFIKND